MSDGDNGGSRPTSLEEMRERMALFAFDESFKDGLTLQLKPTDVVITPFGKSGTTWMQQIVHTLRTRGDMDFDDISRVIPWIETSDAVGIDLGAEQKAEPRAFKSHLDWKLVPKGGRYIVVVRDPGDVVVSMFKFNEGWFWEPGTVSLDEHAGGFLEKRGYYQHLLSWWPRRNDADVLFLAYEHMKEDLTGTIRLVADFIGIDLDAELLEITREHASLDFMLRHKDRFDDFLMRKLSEEKAGLPPGSDSAKVREGVVGSKVVLSSATAARLDELWREEITEQLGYADYAALIADLSD